MANGPVFMGPFCLAAHLAAQGWQRCREKGAAHAGMPTVPALGVADHLINFPELRITR
jgi:hypothetical protein